MGICYRQTLLHGIADFMSLLGYGRVTVFTSVLGYVCITDFMSVLGCGCITDFMSIIGYGYYGELPLSFAAVLGHVDIYDFLIKHGAKTDAQDQYGNTVLHLIVIHRQLVSKILSFTQQNILCLVIVLNYPCL